MALFKDIEAKDFVAQELVSCIGRVWNDVETCKSWESRVRASWRS
jgi:hypothetical protein